MLLRAGEQKLIPEYNKHKPEYTTAKEYVKDNMKVCTVIGFPNGYNTTLVKVFETEDAIKNGADEIDMVINIGDLKAQKYDVILDEINKIKEACNGKILKVIIETCYLNGGNFASIPLKSDDRMTIGYIKRKNMPLSMLGEEYIEIIKKSVEDREK